MEQRKQKTAMILKYAKRRYDGGPEVETIRTIERQQTLEQLNRLQNQQRVLEPAELKVEPAAVNTPAPVAAEPVSPAEAKRNKLLAAAALGPMEICVGTVGIMTATLAIITFRRLKNEELLNQSKTVLVDCLKTLRKGFIDTITTPVRVSKAALAKV
jgi:hypothetical protein